MSKAKFGSVINSLTVEAFIARGDLASAREQLETQRRHRAGSADYTKLAEAIVAFAGMRATGS